MSAKGELDGGPNSAQTLPDVSAEFIPGMQLFGSRDSSINDAPHQLNYQQEDSDGKIHNSLTDSNYDMASSSVDELQLINVAYQGSALPIR